MLAVRNKAYIALCLLMVLLQLLCACGDVKNAQTLAPSIVDTTKPNEELSKEETPKDPETPPENDPPVDPPSTEPDPPPVEPDPPVIEPTPNPNAGLGLHAETCTLNVDDTFLLKAEYVPKFDTDDTTLVWKNTDTGCF